MTRVLVTGGAGFIGSHVCAAYRDAGWDVVALDDLSTGKRENVPDGVELVEMDVRSGALVELIRERRFSLVNHHAAQIDVRVSVERPRHDASVNVDGLLNLLEGCRETGVERVIYISSGGVVYGETDRFPIPEVHPRRPLSPYGVSKLTGEHYLHYYRAVHGLEYAALRYSNVYGPRQDPHGEAGVVAIFGGLLLDGEPLTVFGDGEQTRDYVYVGDVARANLLASEAELPPLDGGGATGAERREGSGRQAGPSGGAASSPPSSDTPPAPDDVAFNIGTGRETSVNELAETMMRATGRRVDVHHAPARPGELERNALDVTRAGEALGWAPQVSLEEGLRRTVEHIAGRREG